MYSLLVALILAAATVLPQSAVIVDSKENFGGEPIDNVKVTFTDGHTEMWTKTGRSQLPKVSSSGLVGWTKYETLYRDKPVFDTLRVVWPDEHHRDYKATLGFIEEWDFADNAAVIIKSRAAHGPAAYQKYDLASGKIIDQAKVELGKELPDWAKPYADK